MKERWEGWGVGGWGGAGGGWKAKTGDPRAKIPLPGSEAEGKISSSTSQRPVTALLSAFKPFFRDKCSYCIKSFAPFSVLQNQSSNVTSYTCISQLYMYHIQHCFICRPWDPGIEPRTVTTLALAARRSNHSIRSHPLSSSLRIYPLCRILFFLI